MTVPAFFRQRPLVAAALAYGAGVLCALPVKGLPVRMPLAGVVLSGIALACLFPRPALRVACAAAGFFFLGILLGGRAAHPVLPAEGKYRVEGRVAGDMEVRDTDLRAQGELRDVAVTGQDGTRIHLPGAYWTWYPKKDAALPGDGDRVSFTGNVYHPSPQMNPYGFDFRMYLLQKGVTVGVSGADEMQATNGAESLAYRVRLAVGKRLDALLWEQSGLARALLIGDKEGMSDEARDDFRDAGIAHVLAVSGLHVGFIVVGLIYLLQLLRLSPWGRFIAITLILLMYCALLGFQASVARACVLASLLLLGRALRRRVDPLTSLAAAFLLILLIRPLDLLSVGFQMSFLAVLGIFTLGDRLNHIIQNSPALSRMPGFPMKVLQAYAVTVSASVMTFVPIVNTFHRFPLVSLLIGPLACVAVGYLMLGFFLPLAVSLISIPLAQALAWPVVRLSELYESFASYSASFAWMSPTVARIPWYAAAALLMLPLFFTRYCALQTRNRAIVIGAMALLSVILLSLPGDPSVRYIQLSMGNADSAVILDGEETWAVDTGENGSELASLLQSEGRGIDALFLTHLHADHAGGLRELLDADVPIGRIFIPRGAYGASAPAATLALLAEAEKAGITVREISHGDEYAAGRVSVKVLWPCKSGIYPGSEANDSSLVTLWNLDGTSMLTTGDIGAGYAGYAYRPAQVLKVPHHGSRAEADRDNLALVSPALALVSASDARPDRYKASAEMLADMGIPAKITGETGALTLRVTENGAELTAHLGGAK